MSDRLSARGLGGYGSQPISTKHLTNDSAGHLKRRDRRLGAGQNDMKTHVRVVRVLNAAGAKVLTIDRRRFAGVDGGWAAAI